MELSDFTRAKEGPVRITTVLKNLVAVTSIFVRGFEFTAAGLILDVRPTWRRPRCCQCRRRGAGYDTQAPRRWRHFGASALELCYVGCGRIDGFIDVRGTLRVTDAAAGILICEEAGGQVTDLEGNDLVFPDEVTVGRSLVATNGVLHNKVVEYLR